MAKYQYKARNYEGKIIEGVYDAPNQKAVIDMIRKKNYFVLEVKDLSERKDIAQMKLFSKVKKKDIAIFCRQFASILKAGVSMIQCINMLSEQTENKILRAILIDISENIQKGSTLSQAMQAHEDKLPPLLINMIAAGEMSGTVDDTLELMAGHYEKDYKLQGKIKSATIYPIVVCVVAVVVVIFMLTAVVPMFIGMFQSSGAELPGITKALVNMSDFLRQNFLVLAIIAALIGIMIKLYLGSDSGRLAFDKALLKMPVIGKLQVKIITARFARTMGTLMATGVPIVEALEITGKVLTNTHAKEGMLLVEESVKQGKGLHQPIKSLEIFPPMLENMVLLGEQSGTLVGMLEKTASFYEEEVDREIGNMTSLLEPAIIVVLGGLIAFIVLAMMLPMFDMMNMIEGM